MKKWRGPNGCFHLAAGHLFLGRGNTRLTTSLLNFSSRGRWPKCLFLIASLSPHLRRGSDPRRRTSSEQISMDRELFVGTQRMKEMVLLVAGLAGVVENHSQEGTKQGPLAAMIALLRRSYAPTVARLTLLEHHGRFLFSTLRHRIGQIGKGHRRSRRNGGSDFLYAASPVFGLKFWLMLTSLMRRLLSFLLLWQRLRLGC